MNKKIREQFYGTLALVAWWAFCTFMALTVVSIHTGCAGGGVRAKGGTSTYHSPAGATANLRQPENPKDGASQNVDIQDVQEIPLPAFVPIRFEDITSVNGLLTTNVHTMTLPEPTVLRKNHSEKSVATVGASQKDTVGETIAKLKSSKWITVLGVLICLGGVVCAVYPPIQTIMGGFMPGAGIAGAGLVIAALPYLIIGNEKFLCIGVVLSALGALAVWFVHHHGGLAATVTTLKSDLKKL